MDRHRNYYKQPQLAPEKQLMGILYLEEKLKQAAAKETKNLVPFSSEEATMQI